MDIDDETLMALADGEITGDAAARLHARIAADPDLAARYALFAQSAHWVKEAALADPEASVSSDLEARVRQMAGADARLRWSRNPTRWCRCAAGCRGGNRWRWRPASRSPWASRRGSCSHPMRRRRTGRP